MSLVTSYLLRAVSVGLLIGALVAARSNAQLSLFYVILASVLPTLLSAIWIGLAGVVRRARVLNWPIRTTGTLYLLYWAALLTLVMEPFRRQFVEIAPGDSALEVLKLIVGIGVVLEIFLVFRRSDRLA